MNSDDTNAHLKKIEVFADGKLIYTWEPVVVGALPLVVVQSKAGELLLGEVLLRGIDKLPRTVQVDKVTGADRVVCERTDGSVEVMTDDETKVFTSREGWQTYWRSLDDWPGKI